MIDESTRVCGGDVLGLDVRVLVAGNGDVRIGPAAVRYQGTTRILAQHRYTIRVAAHNRIATVDLVEEEESDGDRLLRVRVIESREDTLLPEEYTPREMAISRIAILWIPAGATAPTRAHRVVVTPGPALGATQSGGPVLPVLRPDLEPAEVARQTALQPRKDAVRYLRGLQERGHHQLDDAGRDRLLQALAAIHGIDLWIPTGRNPDPQEPQ